MKTTKTIRRYELDWLRIFATFVLFTYHSSRFFDFGASQVKNGTPYLSVEIWWVFVTRWMMPLFFIISGMSLYYATSKFGGWGRFYRDKFLRLFIPVLMASMTFSMVQMYIERLSHGRFVGSFFQFIPVYFRGIYGGLNTITGNFSYVGMHLWYLLFLFIFSLLFYPIFTWFKSGRGQRVLEHLTIIVAAPGFIYLWFAIPLWLLKAILPQSVFSIGTTNWPWIYHIWFLLAGFIIASSDKLLALIANQRWFSLVSGVILTIIHLFLTFGDTSYAVYGLSGDWLMSSIFFISAWCWLFAILGFGLTHLRINHPYLARINEGVLPYYILHLFVLLMLGYFVISWDISDLLKWVSLYVISFIVIISLYIFLIRKYDILRFLFGIKTTRPIFAIFKTKGAIFLLLALWIGLTVFSAFNYRPEEDWLKTRTPLRFSPKTDILLNADDIGGQSESGVQVVNDSSASIGRAIKFYAVSGNHIEAKPRVFVDIRFTAPAGRYYIWLRGKSDVHSEYSDSVWIQLDEEIGTWKGTPHLGDWNSMSMVGKYSWASRQFVSYPISIRHSGNHRIRIQPRQVPHRIDQIWLSKKQDRVPNTDAPIVPDTIDK